MLCLAYYYFVRPQKCNWALFDKCCNMNVKTSELFPLRHILLFWGRGFCGCCHVGVQATVQNVRQKALLLEFLLTAETRAGFQVTTIV